MRTEENVSLKKYNTFNLGYSARIIIHTETEEEAAEALKEYSAKGPMLILGGGSNLLFTGDYKGTIVHPVMMGIRIEKQEGENLIISAGAGVNWDDFVEWTVRNKFYGLENLSLIPGNVGASPVQNIGAYGVEVKDLIYKVDTVSVENGSRRIFQNDECGFGYRYSIFKGREKGKYIVTRVHFILSSEGKTNLAYGALREEVMKRGGITPMNIRQSVIDIRKTKLPDPAVTGNAGSFFKNPIVNEAFALELKKKYVSIPLYDEKPGFIKLAAGWLIEQCGMKGFKTGDAGVHEKQALVIVNYGHASGPEIFKLSEEVRKSVIEKFGIELEREVEIIGPI